MFTRIKENVMEDHEKRCKEVAFYIENGYYPRWAEHSRNNPDRGLKEHSTATRWQQYCNGKITREKAVELATKRAIKEAEKSLSKYLERLKVAADAPELTFIEVTVEWVRNNYWGNNPHATVRTNAGWFEGRASGCGYDKESTAIAEAFNRCPSILKALYELKEKGLAEGNSDRSETSCTGRNNTAVCGYGAGYSSIPYFEGGVGSSCFWDILRKCGFSFESAYNKRISVYWLCREVTV